MKNQSLASHVEQAFGLPCYFFSILLEGEVEGGSFAVFAGGPHAASVALHYSLTDGEACAWIFVPELTDDATRPHTPGTLTT
jgi:hypothetical protein